MAPRDTCIPLEPLHGHLSVTPHHFSLRKLRVRLFAEFRNFWIGERRNQEWLRGDPGILRAFDTHIIK